jgi:hypothetical protein
MSRTHPGGGVEDGVLAGGQLVLAQEGPVSDAPEPLSDAEPGEQVAFGDGEAEGGRRAGELVGSCR